jgi:hypothetical protein
MLDEQVTSVMRSALRSTSKSTKVELKDLRIRMQLTENLESAVCFALNKTAEVSEVSWAKILGVKAIAFKRSIVGSIVDRLHEYAEQLDINKNEINARVYAIDASGTPNVYLYNGKKPLKVIDINELI